MRTACFTVAILLLLLIAEGRAQTQTVIPTLNPSLPRIRFGRTTTFTPGSGQTVFGLRLDRAFRLWQNITNEQRVNINGTDYYVEQVVYNDGADCNAMLVLYERLITVDKVDFLLAPTGFDCQRIALLAENYSIPYLNGADAQLQRVTDTVPEYADLKWTFTTVADYKSTPNCFRAIADLTPTQTFVMAANPEVPDYPGYIMGEVILRNGTLVINRSTYNFLKSTPTALDHNVVGIIDTYASLHPDRVYISDDVVATSKRITPENGITMLDYQRFTLASIQASVAAGNSLSQNCTYFDTFIDEWLELAPHAWIGTSSDYTDIMMLCFNRRKFHPTYFWHWAAINYPPRHAWQYVGSFVQNAWEPAANFSDPIFGSTQAFKTALMKQWNITASSYEAQQAIAGGIAVTAIRATQSLDRDVVAGWLRTFRGSTIINSDTHFIPGTQQTAQQRLCFQVLDTVGTQQVVYPTDYANVKPVVLDPVYDTSEFSKEFPKDKKLSTRDLTLVIVFSILGFVILAIAIAVAVTLNKHHLVFVKKSGTSGENWDDGSVHNEGMLSRAMACFSIGK